MIDHFLHFNIPDAQIQGWTGAVTITGAIGSGNASAVLETATDTLFTVSATPKVDGAAVTYEFDATDGNPGSIAATAINGGAVVLATGKTLDYDTATSHVFKVV